MSHSNQKKSSFPWGKVSCADASPEEKAIFTLSYLSNINGSYLADSEQDLLDNIEGNKSRTGIAGALKQMLNNNWSVVWGPFISNSKVTIHGKEHYVTDNAIFMARYNGNGKDYDGPEFVIAVSGTNPFSMKGWLGEDFLVKETKPWPADFLTINDPDINPSIKDPKISKGTYNGLKILMNTPSQTNSIFTYLQNNFKDVDTEIAVAGHSLGGALSPALALALAQSLKGDQNLKGLEFSACPTAGPTPGNADFAQILSDKLKVYDAIYNEMDVVPQAWNNMTEVPTLLDPASVPPNFTIEGASNPVIQAFFSCASSQPDMSYERLPETPGPNFLVRTWHNGPVDSVTLKKREHSSYVINTLIRYDKTIMADLTKMCGGTKPTKAQTKEFANFIIELGLQHTVAYTSSQESGFQLDDHTMSVIKSCMHSSISQNYTGGKYVLEQFCQAVVSNCYSS